MFFTQARINNLSPTDLPAGKKEKLFFDEGTLGLILRLTRSGGKSFLEQYTFEGKRTRRPLGSTRAISLAQAKAVVHVTHGDLANGIDPALRHRTAGPAAMTLARLIEDWQVLHLNGRRARYAAEATRVLRRAFGPYLDAPAEDLDRPAILGVIDVLSREGHNAMASSTVAYGRSCYGWALRRGAVKVNPFENLPVTATVRRDRVLSNEEIVAIWHATDGPGPFNAIVRLLILTGQRRSEVGGMAWGELANDLASWTIPAARAKNNRTHLVPLPEPARLILRATPRLGALVFPGLGDKPFNGFGKAKSVLDARSGVKGWRLHDLRRTAATGLQALSVRLEVTEAVLNHIGGSRGGIVGVYQRHTYEQEKATALNAWALYVMAIVEGRELPVNVTKLRGAQ